MIKLLQGNHLTATNKRHLSQMIAAGMTAWQSARLRYRLEPLPDQAGRFRYEIRQTESDMWGRRQERKSSGLIDWQA